MYTSSIITAFTGLLALTSAASSSKQMKMRRQTTPVVDVTVTESANDIFAIQVVLGTPKVCIGDNGSAGCNAIELAISPFGANVDVNQIVCLGFSDAAATVPVTDEFDFADPVASSTPIDIVSVLCDYA